MVMNIPQLVGEINTSNWQGVLAITGGGAGAINDLLKRGGGSATLLEAVVPYSNASFEDFVKGKPDKFVSDVAARQLAMAAYLRAKKLEGKGNKPVFGIGASCALAKNGPERKEREHKICIAYQTANRTCSATFKLPHLGREHEESFASHLIIRMIGDCVQKTEKSWIKELGYTEDLLENLEEVTASYEVQKLIHKEISHYFPKPLRPEFDTSRLTLFPGSFNPLHDGHKEMVEIAEEPHCSGPVLYEISVTNVDKPPLDYIEISKRCKQFDGNLVLTNAPLVVQKARIFPNSKFLCGFDSWARIIDPKYYNDDPAMTAIVMGELKNLGASFTVYAREVNGEVRQLAADAFTYGLAAPAPKVPKYMGCSSTKIRQATAV